MHCQVYASHRSAQTYLWVTGPEVLEHLPDSLRELLGALRLVLEMELDAARELPHQDTARVLTHLGTQGWHLQLPPTESADPVP